MKKLRQNQEYLMSNTLSPQAPVWTKWHQERAQNSIMEKDLTRAPNQKYITVRVHARSLCAILYSLYFTRIFQSIGYRDKSLHRSPICVSAKNSNLSLSSL